MNEDIFNMINRHIEDLVGYMLRHDGVMVTIDSNVLWSAPLPRELSKNEFMNLSLVKWAQEVSAIADGMLRATVAFGQTEYSAEIPMSSIYNVYDPHTGVLLFARTIADSSVKKREYPSEEYSMKMLMKNNPGFGVRGIGDGEDSKK